MIFLFLPKCWLLTLYSIRGFHQYDERRSYSKTQILIFPIQSCIYKITFFKLNVFQWLLHYNIFPKHYSLNTNNPWKENKYNHIILKIRTHTKTLTKTTATEEVKRKVKSKCQELWECEHSISHQRYTCIVFCRRTHTRAKIYGSHPLGERLS